jgi:hypothetical protein
MSPVFKPHAARSSADIAKSADPGLGVPRTRAKRGRPKKKKTAERRALESLSPRWQDYQAGRLSVEDLDWEELTRGQIRNASGNFRGGQPKVLPKAFHDELLRRAKEHGQEYFTRNLDVALNSLVRLAQYGEDRERLGASIYITDRVMGLMTQKQEVEQTVTVFHDAIKSGEFLVDLGEKEEELQIEGL